MTATRVAGLHGQVDDRGVDAIVCHVLLDAACSAGVGLCSAEAAVDGAGAGGDDGRGVLADIEKRAFARSAGGFAGDAQGITVPPGHDSAFDNQDVLAGERFDGLLAGFLEGIASSRRKRLGVVERDVLENERRRIGIVGLGKRLGAAGAASKLHPDHRCELALATTAVRADERILFDSLGDVDARHALDADCSGNRTTEREEGTTRKTTRLKRLDKRIFHRYLHLSVKPAVCIPPTQITAG